METYKVENGIVTSPGKFEGEPVWMLELWDQIMGGGSDISLHDGSTAYDAFEIDADIAALTGYRAREGTYVVIWSDDRGFVSHMVMDQNALDALESETANSPELLDPEFDDEATSEWYNGCIQGFDDYPEYDSGF